MTSSVDAADYERKAIRAYLRGADDESAAHWESASRAARAADDPAGSARYAFWLGLGLMMRGQAAPANGWFARARDLVAEAGLECPASGYVLIPDALAALADDPQSAHALSVLAADIGTRLGDADLRALGTLAQGQALIAAGDPVAGVARLDDVMVSVTAEDLGPVSTGIVYCAVILECMGLYDLRRASEWTNALAAWCDSRRDMVPFRGQCLVHRSQLEQAGGNWRAAVESARNACRRLLDPPHPALGLAYYQAGELNRLLGDFKGADHDYHHAARRGHDPVPGLALLQLALGDCAAAQVTIRRALAESKSAPRADLLTAAVEIFRAGKDLAEARTAADQLSNLAGSSQSSVLQAAAAHADGSVLLATGDVAAALEQLRTAARCWQSLCMPYEAAKTAVLLGLACAAMGDHASAEVQFDSARDVFSRLGAAPDVQRIAALMPGLSRDARGQQTEAAALSAREQQVLVHLAAGRTNREIAELLVVSPHTVARHIEHIYAKLGVTSRASATAYAYAHQLL